MFPGIQGGFIGNAGAFTAKANPLLDPRFKIQGGEPWNRTPLLPGKDTQQYEQQQFNIPMQPQLPAAAIGNVGGLLAQAQQVNPFTQNMRINVPSEFQQKLDEMELQSGRRFLYPPAFIDQRIPATNYPLGSY